MVMLLQVSKKLLFKSFKGLSKHLVSDKGDDPFAYKRLSIPCRTIAHTASNNRSTDIEAFKHNDERAFLKVRRLISVIREQGLQDK